MFIIEAPHPVANREFTTWADAARVAVAFGIDTDKITGTEENQ